MPFTGGRRQVRAMFAKGGKSAKTARDWIKRYGYPTTETGRRKKRS